MMRNSVIIVCLFLSLSCFGQDKDSIRFYKEMPHYSSNGKLTWQRDTVCYKIFLSNFDLYKSSNKEYPYLYKYKDNKGEEHYFFIRQKDIEIKGKKVEIKMYDESSEEISVYKMSKDSIFSFKLNN
jgi:hypothetical protein